MKRFIYILILTVFVLILSILLHSCDRPSYFYFDQETKDYCLFGEGSYWIYQDSATLEIDSIVIDNPVYYTIYYAKNKSEHERYYTSISSYSHDNMQSIDVGLWATYRCDKSFLFSCYFNRTKIYHNGKKNTTCEYYYGTILLEEKDICTINGINYSNIKIFKNTYHQTEKIFYWAKYVGIIRIETKYTAISDTTIVRNLIKYNINPYNPVL